MTSGKMNRAVLRTICVIALVFCCVGAAGAAVPAEGDLYIGWAGENITPDGPVALCGQMHTRVSTNVLDPVTCTALAIETRDGGKVIDEAIMVSCDLALIRDKLLTAFRKALAPKLPGFDVRKAFLNATHTHTAPVTEPGVYTIPENVMQPEQYIIFFAERASTAAASAWKNRSRAGVSWGLGQAVVGYNRRAVYFNPVSSGSHRGSGVAKMYGNTNDKNFSSIEGYEDHGLEMLFFWDANKKLTGMLLNIACPSQETEGMSRLSADYWHDVRVELRKRYGRDLYVFPQCGPAGDISPHRMWRKGAEGVMAKRRGLSWRQEIARRVANAVDSVFPYVQKNYIKTRVPFRHIADDIQLPMRKVSKEEYEKFKKICAGINKEKNLMIWNWNHNVIDRYERQQTNPDYPMKLHVIRLGDAAIASNRFELFLDYGIRMKARSKAPLTFIVQLAGPGTYLATAKAAAGSGYSAIPQSNLIGPEGGQILVEETLKRINAMW